MTILIAAGILAILAPLGPTVAHASAGPADVAHGWFGGGGMTAFDSGTATENLVAGTLGLSFVNPSDDFGTLSAGQSATVGVGDIVETDHLGDALQWSVTVTASALTSGAYSIDQSNLSLDSVSTFACGASGCSGASDVSAPGTTLPFSGANPQTVMTGISTARGEFVQSGVQYVLAVPWNTVGGGTPYTGTLTYTITG